MPLACLLHSFVSALPFTTCASGLPSSSSSRAGVTSRHPSSWMLRQRFLMRALARMSRARRRHLPLTPARASSAPTGCRAAAGGTASQTRRLRGDRAARRPVPAMASAQRAVARRGRSQADRLRALPLSAAPAHPLASAARIRPAAPVRFASEETRRPFPIGASRHAPRIASAPPDAARGRSRSSATRALRRMPGSAATAPNSTSTGSTLRRRRARGPCRRGARGARQLAGCTRFAA